MKKPRAFSLIEVVVAVGIFAIAIVSVIGLLGPINKTVTDVRDFDDASRVVSAVQATLQKNGFAAVKGFLDNPPSGNNLLYADRTGQRIALDLDPAWNKDLAGVDITDLNGLGNGAADDINAQKFFQISLTRNDTLSPSTNDTTAGYLAFTITLRWPGYIENGSKFTDTTQQSVMIVPAAITR